jgi:hypothetical protein
MHTHEIIAELDAEIARLQQAKELLTVKRGPGRRSGSSAPTAKRILSPAARARIATAQKARWAKVRKAAK